MKVLMLSDLYPPYIGGLEEHVRNLSRGLVARGHDVSVATIGEPDGPHLEVDEGVRVHRVRSTAQRGGSVTQPRGRPYAPPVPDPEVVLALRRVVARERPDIVHAHNWMLHSFLPLKAWSGSRVVLTLHDYGMVCAKRSLMYRDAACTGPGFEKCLRCASRAYGTGRGTLITIGNWLMHYPVRAGVDRFVAVSQAVADGNALARYGVPYEVVPNFVPDDVALRAEPEHPALDRLPESPFWLFVGAMTRHKGVHLLLRAYERLAGAPPLVVVGTRWPDSPTTFPPGTIVLESLPHGAVMAAWQRAALGIVPSVFPDPAPTVAIEAMACGVPLVASSIGGLPDLVDDGKTGLLVTAGDVDELRGALARFIAEPALGRSMAPAARRKAESFTASAVLARLEAIYSETLRAAA